MRHTKILQTRILVWLLALTVVLVVVSGLQTSVLAVTNPQNPLHGSISLNCTNQAPDCFFNSQPSHTCGNGSDAVKTSIDIGCTGQIGNPIIDVAYAIIKILTDGVGLVIIGSIVVGGIQYSASAGDPQATSRAITRIRESLIALVIFIFGFAILNYVIPVGFLH